MIPVTTLALILLLGHGPGRPDMYVAGNPVPSSCDYTELLAASREWAKAKAKRVFDIAPAGILSAANLRRLADKQDVYERAEGRLLQAVEACGK